MTSDSTDYWLGLSDSTLEGHWFWSDGVLLSDDVDWTNWAAEQPYEASAWSSGYSADDTPAAAMDCVYASSQQSEYHVIIGVILVDVNLNLCIGNSSQSCRVNRVCCWSLVNAITSTYVCVLAVLFEAPVTWPVAKELLNEYFGICN